MSDVVVKAEEMTPAHVFAWHGGTVPGRLMLPGFPPGFEAILSYDAGTMAVKSLTYQTPPGIKTVSFDVMDQKKRKTLAKLPGTQGTKVTIPIHPRFELELRGGAAFLPAGSILVFSAE
jgi:hypothetical protein